MELEVVRKGLTHMTSGVKMNRVWQIAAVVMIIFALLLSGCKQYDIVKTSGEYHTFVMKGGLAKFSFEYPSTYELADINSNRDGGNDVTLYGPYVQSAEETCITIHVGKPEDGQAGYLCYLEDFLRFEASSPEFKLLERFGVTVAGNPGEEVVCSYLNYRGNEAMAKGIPPAPFVDRQVMFNHDGLVWDIFMKGLESTAEADKAIFEHLLETFKILD